MLGSGLSALLLQDIPQQMRQSKLLPAETLFADLCLARRSTDSAGASSSSQTTFACSHSSPCLAPAGEHSPAYWLLAAIDEACSIIPTSRSHFRMLDLARTDSGAVEYAISKASHLRDAGHVIALDSQSARQLHGQGTPLLLWNAWTSKRAVAFSPGGSTWQLQMPDQPLVDLVVGLVSYTEARAVDGLPAPNEHSTAYRSELLWRCLAALTSLTQGKTRFASAGQGHHSCIELCFDLQLLL